MLTGSVVQRCRAKAMACTASRGPTTSCSANQPSSNSLPFDVAATYTRSSLGERYPSQSLRSGRARTSSRVPTPFSSTITPICTHIRQSISKPRSVSSGSSIPVFARALCSEQAPDFARDKILRDNQPHHHQTPAHQHPLLAQPSSFLATAGSTCPQNLLQSDDQLGSSPTPTSFCLVPSDAQPGSGSSSYILIREHYALVHHVKLC